MLPNISGSFLFPRGFAPRTPRHALSRAALPARSVRVARFAALARVFSWIGGVPCTPPGGLHYAGASSPAPFRPRAAPCCRLSFRVRGSVVFLVVLTDQQRED